MEYIKVLSQILSILCPDQLKKLMVTSKELRNLNSH